MEPEVITIFGKSSAFGLPDFWPLSKYGDIRDKWKKQTEIVEAKI